MRVFLNAGHDLSDPGASHNLNRENKLNIGLRDTFLDLMKKDIEVISVPDVLNLRQSIFWINERVNINDIAFSIHFNSHYNKLVRGTEVYYYNDRERHIAEIFSRTVSNALGIPNRGAKPDRLTWIGSLGWVRNLKCDSVLVEVCYLTNDLDMKAYHPTRAAKGLQNAVLEIIPRKVPLEAEKAGREPDLICLPQSLWMRVIVMLQGLIKSLENKRS